MKDTTAAGINRSVKFLFRGLNSKRATSTSLCTFLCIGFTKIKTILRKLRIHNHRQNNLAATGEKHDVMSSTPFCCQVFSRV